MTIRDAEPEDLDAILACVHALAEFEGGSAAVVLDRDEFAANLFRPDAVPSGLIVEPDDGPVAGLAPYSRPFSPWLARSGTWLEVLFVYPEYRRHGYGRALLQELRARTTGRVEWAVLDWNTRAHD